MKIIRYSFHAFKPQNQTVHMKEINRELYDFNLNGIPEFLKRVVLERHEKMVKFYTENLEDFKRGIWVFVDGHKNNMALNHLKCKVPCFEAEIDEDTEVYGVNLDHKMKINDCEVEAFGCYIPERSLKSIHNVKRRYKKSA